MWTIKIETCRPVQIGENLNIKFDHNSNAYKLYNGEDKLVGKIVSDINDTFNRLSTQQVHRIIGMDYQDYTAKVFAVVNEFALANLESNL